MKSQNNRTYVFSKIHLAFFFLLMSCFLLHTIEVKAQQEQNLGNGESLTEVDAPSLLGLYRTADHTFYKKQYGTIQYSTIEFKEDNKVELIVVTDNRKSTLKSDKETCHIRKAVDNLEYKINEDGSIEMYCLKKHIDYCGDIENKNGCFDYALKATVTGNKLRIDNNEFIKQ